MAKRDHHDPPCEHWDNQIGTVSAGDIKGTGPFCGVATCAKCVVQSQGYVQMRTGLPASDLFTYEEARRQSSDCS